MNFWIEMYAQLWNYSSLKIRSFSSQCCKRHGTWYLYPQQVTFWIIFFYCKWNWMKVNKKYKHKKEKCELFTNIKSSEFLLISKQVLGFKQNIFHLVWNATFATDCWTMLHLLHLWPAGGCHHWGLQDWSESYDTL